MAFADADEWASEGSVMDMSKLVEKYENSSVLRSLIQLIPYAPVLESAVLTRHKNIIESVNFLMN